MPNMSTQTSPPMTRKNSFAHLPSVRHSPPITPPSSEPELKSSACSSIRGVHVIKRARAVKGGKSRPFNMYVDGIHISMPSPQAAEPAKKPQMKSVGVQAGEPQIKKAKAGKWMRRWLKFCEYALPIVRILLVVPMFFVDRVGFGVSLNGLFGQAKS